MRGAATVLVRLSAAAEADLAAIFDFTFARRGEDQAHRYLAGLHERLDTLAASPAPTVGGGSIRLRHRSHDLFLSRDGGDPVIARSPHVAMDERRHLP